MIKSNNPHLTGGELNSGNILAGAPPQKIDSFANLRSPN